MNTQTDQQLLREYAAHRSDDAITALVGRHYDLVLTAARRVLGGDVHLAKDVAQEVFKTLLGKAAQLLDRPSLEGWLLKATHLEAVEAMRAEERRRVREQKAAAMTPIYADESDDPWQHVAPHLDGALVELPEADREAVIQCYFKRKSAKEVATILGTTEEAAQKRIHRALDRLREILAERGVTVGTSALGALISANAIQAAPVGLAASVAATLIAAKAATAAATGTAATAKVITMTTLHKTLVVSSLVGGLGVGLFGIHKASVARADAQKLAQQHAEQMDQKQRELDEKDRQLAAEREANRRDLAERAELLRLRGIVGLLRAAGATPNGPKAETAAETEAWRDRRRRLQARVDQTPEAQVPELQLATEKDWLDASKEPLETEQDYRKALSTLRYAAEGKLVVPMQAALNRFMAAHPGQYPTAVEQLAPYFEPPVNPALLARWKVEPPDEEDAKFGAIGMITQTPVDPEFDRVWLVGPAGYGSSSMQKKVIKEDPAVTPGSEK